MALLPFYLLLFLLSAHAQELPSNCREDQKRICPDVKSFRDGLDCLTKNLKDLSKECQADLQRISQLVKETGGARGGGMPSFGGSMGGLLPPSKKILTVGGTLAPEEVSTNNYRVNAATPLWAWDDHSTAVTLNAQRIELGENKTISDGPEKTPRRLDRVELSGVYSRKLSDKKFVGGRLQVGSASDRPFHSNREMSYTAMGFYGKPAEDGNFWLYSVFISNNNPIANFLPIPGVTYVYRNDKFTGLFGLPFNSIQWTPVPTWSFSLSFLITNMTAEVTYGLKENIQWSAGYSRSQQTFLRHEREKLRDRLFFTENRLYVGMKTPADKSLSWELQSGLAFDRQLREGTGFSNTDLLMNLHRSWYVSAGTTYLF